MSTSHHHVTRTDALVVGDIIRDEGGVTYVVESRHFSDSLAEWSIGVTAEENGIGACFQVAGTHTFEVLCALDHGTVAVALDGDEAHPVQPLAVGAPWNGFVTPILAVGDTLALLDRAAEALAYIVDDENGVILRFALDGDEGEDTFLSFVEVDGVRGVDFRNAGMTFVAVGHVNYPHEYGTLYDCPGCEARCHCDDDPGTMPCVWCASDTVNVCPACAEPIDYCQGHGEIGDPVGAAILAAESEHACSPFCLICSHACPTCDGRVDVAGPCADCTDAVTITLTSAQAEYLFCLVDSDDDDESAESWGIDHDVWESARAVIINKILSTRN